MVDSIMATETQIKNWIELSIKNENLTNYKIKIKTNSAKNGFVGDLIYANIKGENHQKVKYYYNLIIKYLNKNSGCGAFAKQEMFECEIFMYTKVFPIYEQFQKDKNIIEAKQFKNYPKCYFDPLIVKQSSEYIVLENLNFINYELWPRTQPINIEHTELVFKKYAKFHALSFALKDQKREVFDEIVRNCTKSTFSMFMQKTNAPKAMADNIRTASNLFKTKLNSTELNKIENLIKNVRYILTEIYLEDPDFSVISHGDCWNNNYLYKYQEEQLIDVKILDWQCSVLSPPILDLSYFFYTTSGKPQYENYQQLLDTYYKSLSSFLKELGSDPEKCYPYQKFLEQWRKYSVYGFVIAPVFIKMVWMGYDEDLPKYDTLLETDPNREQVFNTKINDFDRYRNCMFDLFKHYLNLDCL